MYYLKAERPCHKIIPPHCHNYFEFVYYYTGSGKVYYRSNPHALYRERKQIVWIDKMEKNSDFFSFSPGVMHLILPNTIHNELHDANSSDVLAVGFSLTEREAKYLKNAKVFDRDETLRALMLHIEKEFTEKAFRHIENINAYLSLALNQVLRLTQTNPKSEVIDLEYTVNYFDAYFMTDINVASIASMVGYCPDHFRILFKKKTGYTPKQYIIDKRITYARQLLTTTDLSLKTIAENCGYQEYFQFNNIFKKYFGYPPSKAKTRGAAAP